MVLAIWFYARVWDYVPDQYKAKINPSLERLYKKYHGGLDGLDDVRKQAATTTFPPASFTIVPAKTPAQLIDELLASTPDWNTLALADKETVLAVGSKEDADKLWALLQGKDTQVPGKVIEAANIAKAIKVVVTAEGKPSDFEVKLATPVSVKSVPAAGSDFKTQKDFILSSGDPSDIEKLKVLLSDDSKPAPKVSIEPIPTTVIKLAVTQDAKDSNTANFIINLKTPLADKEIPAKDFIFGVQPAAQLNGTYDTYTQIPATDTTAPSAQIVLKDGVIQPAEKKKPVTPAHKPSAAHHAAAAH